MWRAFWVCLFVFCPPISTHSLCSHSSEQITCAWQSSGHSELFLCFQPWSSVFKGDFQPPFLLRRELNQNKKLWHKMEKKLAAANTGVLKCLLWRVCLSGEPLNYSSTTVVGTGQRPQHSVWDFQIQRCLRNKEENASSIGATNTSGLSFLGEVPKLHCGQQLATEAIACCLLMSSQTRGGEMCFCLEQKKKMGHG